MYSVIGSAERSVGQTAGALEFCAAMALCAYGGGLVVREALPITTGYSA